jgi:hypothetical protein
VFDTSSRMLHRRQSGHHLRERVYDETRTPSSVTSETPQSQLQITAARRAFSFKLSVTDGDVAGDGQRPPRVDPTRPARLLDHRLQLLALLRAHGAEQEREREKAAQLWHGEEWVFTSPIGEPLKYHTDFREWKRLLRHAGLREARLHDARHTAATVLQGRTGPDRDVADGLVQR